MDLASYRTWVGVAITFAPRTYATAVQAAGGIAWIMPPDRAAPDDPDAWLGRIDALLLAGGGDITPAAYGETAEEQTGAGWPDRDNFEVALVRAAIDRGLPVLGVCRGMQLLNVALGGTLEQHLPGRIGSDRHCPEGGEYSTHDVELEPGSLAERAVGSPASTVRSHHHQGLDRLGEGLVVTGRCPDDGVIEAVELRGAGHVLGVLWHPEEDERSRVIGALVDAARERVGAGA